MRFVTIVGARPQFIKAAPLCAELRKYHEEILVHTGQHYDPNMSDVFFAELAIPRPDRHLGVGSGTHAAQTGAMLERIEQVLLEVQPHAVIVFGDTNSTIAGALAAAKLHIPVAHVEAGLRSFNRRMPEEINRVVTDHLSTWLFAPSANGVQQLAREGIVNGVYLVGDIMADSLRIFRPIARQKSTLLNDLGLTPGNYFAATIHRPANTDDRQRLQHILQVLSQLPYPTIFPCHPRTRAAIDTFGFHFPDVAQRDRATSGTDGGLQLVAPLGYLDMLSLQENARAVITDSGGIQKEAFLLEVPCFTLREETEWPETVAAGWNRLVGSDVRSLPAAIASAEGAARPPHDYPYGRGDAAVQIVHVLSNG